MVSFPGRHFSCQIKKRELSLPPPPPHHHHPKNPPPPPWSSCHILSSHGCLQVQVAAAIPKKGATTPKKPTSSCLPPASSYSLDMEGKKWSENIKFMMLLACVLLSPEIKDVSGKNIITFQAMFIVLDNLVISQIWSCRGFFGPYCAGTRDTLLGVQHRVMRKVQVAMFNSAPYNRWIAPVSRSDKSLAQTPRRLKNNVVFLCKKWSRILSKGQEHFCCGWVNGGREEKIASKNFWGTVSKEWRFLPLP